MANKGKATKEQWITASVYASRVYSLTKVLESYKEDRDIIADLLPLLNSQAKSLLSILGRDPAGAPQSDIVTPPDFKAPALPRRPLPIKRPPLRQLLADFISQECLLDPDGSVKAKRLYTKFKEWWVVNIDQRCPSQKAIGSLLRRSFIAEKHGTYEYFGLDLKNTPTD
jgi:hypothetical protein